MYKNKKEIKVFHGMVNYGTQAGLLSRGLRKANIKALSVSYFDRFNRFCDIVLPNSNNKNLYQKAIYYIKSLKDRLNWFREYNIFHFYFGTTLLPFQLDLPFYKIFGKKVIMEYLGNDVQLYKKSIEKYSITNQKYYYTKKIDGLKADRRKIFRLWFESNFVDKQLVCAPYISEFVQRSIVFPLAIDITEYQYIPQKKLTDEIIILHAPSHRGNKGTVFILEAIDRLKNNGYNIKLLLVENVSHSEIKEKYIQCDIFVDQLVAGWYGTASIEAMAIGRPVVCFLRESYFKYIDYGDSIPIINANPSTIYEVLKKLILEKYKLPEIGAKSRKFVEKIHALDVCIEKLINIYNKL